MTPNAPSAVHVSRATAAYLAQQPCKSDAIRRIILDELAQHPELPVQAQLPGADRVQLTVRLGTELDQALAHYAQYGLRRAFIARALERACSVAQAGFFQASRMLSCNPPRTRG